MTKKNVKKTTKASSATVAATPKPVEPKTWRRGDGVDFDLSACTQVYDAVTKRWILLQDQADVSARPEKWAHAKEMPSA